MHMFGKYMSARSAATAALCLVALASTPASTHAQQFSRRDFADLVALAAARLELSRKVALTKWDTRQPVADPPGDPREKAVIDAATSEARAEGLSSELAAAFFADQIEASKLVQFALISDWWRAGGAPTEPRADLRMELRPALDSLRGRFIAELLATRDLGTGPDCKLHVARSAASHVATHRLTPLFAVALDRGLASVCAD